MDDKLVFGEKSALKYIFAVGGIFFLKKLVPINDTAHKIKENKIILQKTTKKTLFTILYPYLNIKQQ